MRIACVLLISVLLTTLMLCRLYARYMQGGSLNAGARTASCVFQANDKADSRFLNLSNIQKPGDIQTYTFHVTNSNGRTVSETAISYDFAVELTGNMPIKCTISDQNNNKVLETGVLESSPVKAQVLNAGALAPSLESDDTYTITVEWPEAVNDASFASRNAVAEAMLTVTAQQVD